MANNIKKFSDQEYSSMNKDEIEQPRKDKSSGFSHQKEHTKMWESVSV